MGVAAASSQHCRREGQVVVLQLEGHSWSLATCTTVCKANGTSKRSSVTGLMCTPRNTPHAVVCRDGLERPPLERMPHRPAILTGTSLPPIALAHPAMVSAAYPAPTHPAAPAHRAPSHARMSG